MTNTASPSNDSAAATGFRAALQSGAAQAVAEGIFDFTVDGEPRLAGSECEACGTRVFPASHRCPSCFSSRSRRTLLSDRGVLDSYTVVRQAPPGWRGSVPYVIAKVVVEGGLTVHSQLVGAHAIQSGMQLRLVLRSLYKDEQGRDVIAPVFAPA